MLPGCGQLAAAGSPAGRDLHDAGRSRHADRARRRGGSGGDQRARPVRDPFEPARETADITAFLSAGFRVQPALTALERANAAQPYLMATQTAVLAAPFIWASGREVLPVGGFTGTIPEPTLATLRRLIQANFVRTFLQSPTTTDPRLVWVDRHCLHVRKRTPGQKAVLPIAVYFCL